MLTIIPTRWCESEPLTYKNDSSRYQQCDTGDGRANRTHITHLPWYSWRASERDFMFLVALAVDSFNQSVPTSFNIFIVLHVTPPLLPAPSHKTTSITRFIAGKCAERQVTSAMDTSSGGQIAALKRGTYFGCYRFYSNLQFVSVN